MRQRSPSDEEAAGQVDVEHLAPQLQAHLRQGGALHHAASVVHQDVQAAQGVNDRHHGVVDLLLVGCVQPDRERSTAVQPSEFVQQFAVWLMGEIGERDFGALPCESPNDAQPYPDAATGDQHTLAREILDHAVDSGRASGG